MGSFLDSAIDSAIAAEKKRKKTAAAMTPFARKELKNSGMPESRIVLPVKKHLLNERIAGVDSGFVGKNLYSLDILLVRARSAIFTYSRGKLSKSEYFPLFASFPEPLISNAALEKSDISTNKSLQRLKKEITLAEKVVEEFSPRYCFLDGSIVPQHADKPRENSKMKPFYLEVIRCFESLFETAEEKKCDLVACVEDSRGTRFGGILQECLSGRIPGLDALNECYDSAILNYLLGESERTFAFPYASNANVHPVLKDFSKTWAERVHVLYLKPSALDRPLRIEFLSEKSRVAEKAEKLSAVAFALSSMHRSYAYPSVLIEADLRARLKPEEINVVCDKIFDRLGRHFLGLRREARPF